MKIKLTPELSYVIGLWKLRRTKEGIGIDGNQYLREAFVKAVLDAKLTDTKKLQIEGNKIFFYHTAYRKFFQDVLKEEDERFRYQNDYAKAFFAGLFDSKGGYSKDGKMVYIVDADKQDEMAALRLGFRAKLFKKQLMITDKSIFLAFVGKFRKVKLPDEEF